MIKISLTVTKIPRDRIKPGKKVGADGVTHKYADFILVENRDGVDQYGNDGFVSMDVSKEEREAGVKGAIVGNWKTIGAPRSAAPAAAPRPPADPDLDADADDDFAF